MSDIGMNIEGMLAAVDSEIAQLESRFVTLKQRRETLQAWLLEEAGPTQPQLPALDTTTIEAAPLSKYLFEQLSRSKPRNLKELTKLAVARKLVASDDSPGRKVHFALVGLGRRGYAKRDEDGWVQQGP